MRSGWKHAQQWNLILGVTSSCSSHVPTCRRQRSCRPSPSPALLPHRSPCLLRPRPCLLFAHPHLVFLHRIPVEEIYFRKSLSTGAYYRFSCVRGFLLLPISACSCFGLEQRAVNGKEKFLSFDFKRTLPCLHPFSFQCFFFSMCWNCSFQPNWMTYMYGYCVNYLAVKNVLVKMWINYLSCETFLEMSSLLSLQPSLLSFLLSFDVCRSSLPDAASSCADLRVRRALVDISFIDSEASSWKIDINGRRNIGLHQSRRYRRVTSLEHRLFPSDAFLVRLQAPPWK